MNLKGKQKAFLKKKAHNMQVTVMIGDKGITDNLVKSLEDNLVAHELVKASISHPEKSVRAEISEELAKKTNSTVADIIGKTVLLFRINPKNPLISKELGKIK